MSSVLPGQLLKAQHRRIDTGIEGVLGGDNDLLPLREALTLLRRHVYLEEQFLFPPLASSGLGMPVFVMKREHGQMWPLMERLQMACDAGASAGTLGNDCRSLVQLLQIHNPKEEAVIYSAADQLADASLVENLDRAQPPAGWSCELAPH